MNSPPKIPLQLQRQRQQRHQKLMKMINSYEQTKEEKNKLERIKSHTMLEINLRYLRSQINRNYKFPKLNKSLRSVPSSERSTELNEQTEKFQDDLLRQQFQLLEEQNKGKKKHAEYLVYDLRRQNQQKNKNVISKDNQLNTYTTKVLSLQQSRRVHSLGNQKSLEKEKLNLITKRHNPIRNSKEKYSKSPPNLPQSKSTRSLKTIKPISLTRRQSKQKIIEDSSLEKYSPFVSNSKKLIVDSRKLKLPQINTASSNQLKTLRKLNPISEKLKTQKIYTEEQIQLAIGKKLVTETATDSAKKPMKGIEKYLKQIQIEKKNQFHLNINLNNNQQSKLMKKEKDHSKRKGNFQIFQSAKQSIKRQIQ